MTTEKEMQQIYEKLERTYKSLVPNDNKANDFRKLFERTLKVALDYDLDDSSEDLFSMINTYVEKSKNYDLQYILHKLRKNLNGWSHDAKEIYHTPKDEELLEYYIQMKNIIYALFQIEHIDDCKSVDFSIDKLELNKEQKKAALSTNRLTLVNAGPGTGKTHLIIGRILNEINTYPKKKIFALSFTNKAAEGLQQKLDNEIFSTSLVKYKSNIYTGTIHSFVLKLIQEYFEINNKSFDYIIIDDTELKDISGEFNNNKEAIDNYFMENKILTFDKIIEMFIKTIKNNQKFKDFLVNKIDEIVIDEAQDLDKEQYEILSLLYELIHCLKLFFVGDQRQNLYAFKGGSLSNVLEFFDDEKDVSVIELKYSYRCPQKILSFVNKIDFGNLENIKLESAYNKNNGILDVHIFEDKREEADWIAKLIQEKIKNGKELNEISILYTSTFYFKEILESLNAYKIPFKVFGGQWVINEHIRLFRFILSYIYSKNKYALTNIQKFWIDNKLEGETIKDLLLQLSDMDFSKKPNYEKLKIQLDFLLLEYDKKEKISVLNILDKWINLIEKYKLFKEDSLNIFHLFKETVDNDLTLDDYDKLKLSFSPMHPSLNKFYMRSDEIVDSEWYNDDNIFISIATIHAAKGLEWDNVIIPGMAQDSFPRWYSDNETKEKEIPNETKKFYVACTRTKENLYLTRPKKVTIKSKKNGKFYTFPREKSIFLNYL